MRALALILFLIAIATATATEPTPTPTPTPSATCTGVFTIPRGVYELMSGKLDTPLGHQSALDRPTVDGIRLKARWQDVEKSPGVNDWRNIDVAISDVAGQGKHCGLSINAGSECPAWLYLTISATPGATGPGDATHSAWYVLADTGNDAGKQIPVPGDPVFVSRWLSFIRAFGAHIASLSAAQRAALSYIDLTGPGNHDEVNIANGTADTAALGNTQAKVDVWIAETKTFIDAFAAAFPDKTIYLVLKKPFANTMGTAAEVTVANYAARYARYGFAFNGLNPKSSASNPDVAIILQYSATHPTAAQFGQAGGGFDGIPLSEGVDQGLRSALALKIRFVEIYKPDVDTDALYSYTAPAGATWQGRDVAGSAAGINPRRAEMLAIPDVPCASPTPTPTTTATIEPTPSATNTPVSTPTPSPDASPSSSPTSSPIPTPTATIPNITPSPTASPTPSATATGTPTPTATPSLTPTPTATATPSPVATKTPTPTPRPTSTPTVTPTAIRLSAVRESGVGSWHLVSLSWTGARSSLIDIYSNGTWQVMAVQDGWFQYSCGRNGSVRTWKICEAATNNCSNTVSK